MPIPNQAQVNELLKPHEATLTGVVLRAWERWMTNPERPQLYRRSMATLIHNYMMLDAIPALPSQGIRAIERHESALFFVGDRLLVRFKKGNENGLSSNIATQAALAFNDPNENLNLFDLPNVDRVDIAYRLNDIETSVDDILVVARQDERVLWSYPIYQARSASGASDTIRLPIDLVEPPPAESGLRVPEGMSERRRSDASK